MNYENMLPKELWQQVLEDVSTGDLCNVVKTSRHMNDMASWPNLWAMRGMKVNMRKVKETGLAKLYEINRFKKIKKLDLTHVRFTQENSKELEQLLKDIPGSPIQHINFKNVNLSRLSENQTEMLARAISHLQTVNLEKCYATTMLCLKNYLNPQKLDFRDQIHKVLEASLSSTTLIDINFGGVNFSSVNGELLARAISRLQTVNLAHSFLDDSQRVKVREACLSSTTLIKWSNVQGYLPVKPVKHPTNN